jgi:hypothetical protein
MIIRNRIRIQGSMEDQNMHVAYRHELVKQAPPARHYAETSTSFPSGNGIGENAATLHRILALTLACFDTWLKPLFLRAERQNLSPIQEYDPYVKGLARYLQSQRMD